MCIELSVYPREGYSSGDFRGCPIQPLCIFKPKLIQWKPIHYMHLTQSDSHGSKCIFCFCWLTFFSLNANLRRIPPGLHNSCAAVSIDFSGGLYFRVHSSLTLINLQFKGPAFSSELCCNFLLFIQIICCNLL